MLDLHDRMQTLRIDMPAVVVDVHLVAIGEALASPVPGSTPPVRRRWAVVLTSFVLVFGSTGVAFAAEESLPGEVLYPVKRATEWVRGWVDESISAEHRIEELATLLDRRADDAAISEQTSRARLAVDELGDPELEAKLDALIDRVDAPDAETDVVPPTTTAPTEPPATTAPPDRERESEDPPATDRRDPPPTTTTRPSEHEGDGTTTTRPPDRDGGADTTSPPSDNGGDTTPPPADEDGGGDRREG